MFYLENQKNVWQEVENFLGYLRGETDEFRLEEQLAERLENIVKKARGAEINCEANPWRKAVTGIADIVDNARQNDIDIGRIACRLAFSLGYKPEPPDVVTDVEGFFGFRIFRTALEKEMGTSDLFNKTLNVEINATKNSILHVAPPSAVDFRHVEGIANILRYPFVEGEQSLVVEDK